ncbi:glyoxylate/hydroxypyruvate reductase B-like [Amphiura filiformis]|uniref:glyoxylate/hydroxypyruvate reductase B-like n=1 Tax=Amphiura filiformis TaxID=82378 RepID=UPI003B210914
MASEKYCVVVPERFQTDPNCKTICDLFDVVWLQDFLDNTKKYREKIQGHFSTHTTFPEDVVASMPKLKVVSAYGVGVDHLDVGMYNRYGVKIGNTPNVLNDCAADQAMTLMLASARKLVNGFDLLRKGQTSVCYTYAYLGNRVTGSTIGIVGMGRIGYKVAERAIGFQMKVIYHNRNRRSEEEEKHINATYCSNLDDLLSQSDFVVLVTPLSAKTKGLIGADQLKKMKPTAILINIGRGPLIDQDALVEALKAGHLGGAGLDVTDPEPLPVDHPLLDMSNVTIAPHLGSATKATRQVMFEMCIENIKAGIEGRPLASEVLPS